MTIIVIFGMEKAYCSKMQGHLVDILVIAQLNQNADMGQDGFRSIKSSIR